MAVGRWVGETWRGINIKSDIILVLTRIQNFNPFKYCTFKNHQSHVIDTFSVIISFS